MEHFALSIQEWYRLNHRKLPWRETDDPYFIWVSEVILQQTRVQQGLAHYYRFIETFPNVETLANAEEQEVLAVWQGLGYYSRARNLHFAAKQIMNDFQGKFPDNYQDIMLLKGVGEYTGAAIASFAFHQPYPVIDGNVYRVLSRYFNDATPIDTGEGKKTFKQYVKEVFNTKEPAKFNQAIMELGALVCKPKNPDCQICPLQSTCLGFSLKTYETLPVKSKKIKVQKRFFHYLIFPTEKIQLTKREKEDIWKNMYEFPLIETVHSMNKKEFSQFAVKKLNVKVKKEIHTEKRVLSHQHLYVSFWEIALPLKNKEIINVSLQDIERYPLPRVIEKFINEYF